MLSREVAWVSLGLASMAGLVASCADGAHHELASAPSASSASIAPGASSSTEAFAVAPAASTSDSAPAPSASAAPPKPQIATTRLIAWIYEKPSLESTHVGYLRVGARATRSAEPIEKGTTACGGKWWGVEPAGYLCEGHEGVTTDVTNPSVVAAGEYPPRTDQPLPYGYGTSNGAPLYTRVPTKEEQAKVEGDVAAHAEQLAAQYAKLDPAKVPPRTAIPIGDMPDFLASNAPAPPVNEWMTGATALTVGWAWGSMRLAFESAFEVDGRAFYLTTEHFIVPADRIRAARLADFHGIQLARDGEPGEHLPIAWVRWRPAKIYRVDAEKDVVVDTGTTLAFQQHAGVADKELELHGVRYLELLSPPNGQEAGRYLVRPGEVSRIDAAKELPYAVAATDRWIEVKVAHQSLTLYQGLTPIFTTLVSTGVDGVGDVETTRSTPRGAFRIHSKHITYRMSADEHPPWKEGDKPDPKYRIDDVPYVQYFSGGYALHAAFWHDAFGQPKSHGCINLSPRDAVWLFGQTDPVVPPGWHGIYSGRAGAAQGTMLIVRIG